MRIEDEESLRKEATFKASFKKPNKFNSIKKDKYMTKLTSVETMIQMKR